MLYRKSRLDTRQKSVRRSALMRLAGSGLILVAGGAAGGVFGILSSPNLTAQSTSASFIPNKSPYPPPPTFSPLTRPQISLLPEANYRGVILDLPLSLSRGETVAETYFLTADVPIYANDLLTPVARFAAHNFLGKPTVVVSVQQVGDWTLVLTPARKTLPSRSGGVAPAQTQGWVRTRSLGRGSAQTQKVDISVSAQTLTITGPGTTKTVFAVGVGAPSTPTPTGVTGYIQARFLDAAQGQSVYPIQLTSLHSAASDEPYRGRAGGLIEVHFEPRNTGDISHGCVRLGAQAIIALNALPLGTLVSIIA